MIYALTLNPAIDKTLEIINLKVRRLNKINSSCLDASGKDVNFSKVIKVLGGHSITLGSLRGCNGDFILKEIKKMGIMESFIDI
ncbi:MAG: hypothetical protein P8Y70_08930 [Candidatus Lokiarchaeota archaeon]